MRLRLGWVLAVVLAASAATLGPRLWKPDRVLQEFWRAQRTVPPHLLTSWTYRLERDRWLTFQVPSVAMRIRILTNPAGIEPPPEACPPGPAAEIDECPKHAEWKYVIEYELLDKRGARLTGGLFQFRTRVNGKYDPATGRLVTGSSFIGSELQVGVTRELALSIEEYGGEARRLRVRLVDVQPPVRRVLARVYCMTEAPAYRLNFLWKRASRAKKERIARSHVYPLELISPGEQRNMLRRQWWPLAPSGIDGTDFEKWLLVSDPDFQTNPPEIRQPVPGYPVGPSLAGVVPVPGPPGLLRLSFHWPDIGQLQPVRLRWFGRGVRRRARQEFAPSGRTAVVEWPVQGGLVEIDSPYRGYVRAWWRPLDLPLEGQESRDESAVGAEKPERRGSRIEDRDPPFLTPHPSSLILHPPSPNTTDNGQRTTDQSTDGFLEITPEPVFRMGYVTLAGEAVEFDLSHLPGQATPFRLVMQRFIESSKAGSQRSEVGGQSLEVEESKSRRVTEDAPARPPRDSAALRLFDSGTAAPLTTHRSPAESRIVNPPPCRLRWELLDAEGAVVRHGWFSLGGAASRYDRANDLLAAANLTEPVERYFAVPPGVERLRIRSSDAAVLVTGYTRPPDVPRVLRVPEDSHAWHRRRDAHRTWFQLPPRGASALREQSREVKVFFQPRPPEDDPEVLAGDYDWDDFHPAGPWQGRFVLTPIQGSAVRGQGSGVRRPKSGVRAQRPENRGLRIEDRDSSSLISHPSSRNETDNGRRTTDDVDRQSSVVNRQFKLHSPLTTHHSPTQSSIESRPEILDVRYAEIAAGRPQKVRFLAVPGERFITPRIIYRGARRLPQTVKVFLNGRLHDEFRISVAQGELQLSPVSRIEDREDSGQESGVRSQESGVTSQGPGVKGREPEEAAVDASASGSGLWTLDSGLHRLSTLDSTVTVITEEPLTVYLNRIEPAGRPTWLKRFAVRWMCPGLLFEYDKRDGGLQPLQLRLFQTSDRTEPAEVEVEIEPPAPRSVGPHESWTLLRRVFRLRPAGVGGQGSGVSGQGAGVRRRGSRIEIRGSRIEDRGSRSLIAHRSSLIPEHNGQRTTDNCNRQSGDHGPRATHHSPLTSPALVLGSDGETLDSGQFCVVPLGDDLPAGRCRIHVRRRGDAPAYLIVSQTTPGRSESREVETIDGNDVE